MSQWLGNNGAGQRAFSTFFFFLSYTVIRKKATEKRKKEPTGNQIEHTQSNLPTKFVDAHARNNNMYSEGEKGIWVATRKRERENAIHKLTFYVMYTHVDSYTALSHCWYVEIEEFDVGYNIITHSYIIRPTHKKETKRVVIHRVIGTWHLMNFCYLHVKIEICCFSLLRRGE